MGDTSIEWTDKTWNPLRGCTEVSPGCAHCYAAAVATRFSGPGQPYEGLAYRDASGKPHWTGKLRMVSEKLDEPLRWKKPARIFVNSMSDLFHPKVPFDFIDRVFAIMADCPRHTFQVLTKRAHRMAEYFADRTLADVFTGILRLEDVEGIGQPSPHGHLRAILRVADSWKIRGSYRPNRLDPPSAWPLPNVWLGVSVEDQKRADERIPHLLRTPAAVRFLSVEPMLGPIDLKLEEWQQDGPDQSPYRMLTTAGQGLSWVIVGGESGHLARPFDLAWARSIRDQCREASVAFFMKQLGAKPMGAWHPPDHAINWTKPLNGSHWDLRDSHGGDWDEWPADLRVREFPTAHLAHSA